jgi:UDP-glucose 4-epimerase
VTAELSGQQWLVTGGAGFIGRHVVGALRRSGAEVSVLDLRESGLDGVDQITGDMTDHDVLDEALKPGLAGIIHLAAMTSVLGSLRDPGRVYQCNVHATADLLELARQRGITRFVFASSNAVTGDVGQATITEDLPLRPLTPYGATKAAAEMLVSGYAGGYDLHACSLRLTNVYGPGMAHKDSMVPRLMRAAISGEPVQIYGTGLQRRDFVHVSDVVDGLMLAIRHECRGALIVGSGRSRTVLELLAAAREVTGAPIPAHHVAPKAGEMPAVVVSIQRAAKLGYHPRVELTDGLGSAWEDFRAG